MLRAGGLAGMMGISLSACSPTDIFPHEADEAAISRGKAAAQRIGCAACHDIPDINWPKGRMGPRLHGFGNQTLIAGRLPNRPDQLAAFVRNAPAAVPGTAMPALPMTQGDAEDIAAWLRSLRDD